MPRSLRRCFVSAKLAAAEMGNRRTEPVVGRLDMGIDTASSLLMLGLSMKGDGEMRHGQLVPQRHPLGARRLRP